MQYSHFAQQIAVRTLRLAMLVLHDQVLRDRGRECALLQLLQLRIENVLGLKMLFL